MLIQIPQVLNAEQIAECRKALAEADWVDGRVTAGHQAAKVKNNRQLAEDHPTARKLGEIITKALSKNPLFVSAALPLKVFPPMFNSYAGGEEFGSHVDTAIRQIAGTGLRVRTDLSATLFLTEPADYDGGELVVEDTFGIHKIKLPAGNMILYPSSSLHHVEPVTRGERVSSFFWIQSVVRSDEDRTILFDLDNSIQQILRDLPNNPAGTRLTGVYHNLLRRWADV